MKVTFPELDLGALDAIYFSAARSVSPKMARRLGDSPVPVVAALSCAHQLERCAIVVASDQNFEEGEGADWWGALRRRCIQTQWLVVTLGRRGAWATDGTNVLTLPAAPAPRVIDTTGAGDALPQGWSMPPRRSWSIKAALALASQWGADAVSHLASGCPLDHKPL